MSMTRRSKLLLCGLLVTGLAACGGGEEETTEGTDLQTVEGDGARLEVPREVSAGAPVEVMWTGPDDSDDYISVAEEGTDDDAYVDYTRTRRGSPLTVRVPDMPGKYEVRYVSAENDEVLVRAPLTVVDVEATLDVPAAVGAGSPIEVTWTGPDNPDDYISIAERGTDDEAYVDYTRTRRGSPLTVRAPDTPGSYEIRYVMAQSDRVIARSNVSVEGVEAELDVPDTLMVETPAPIHWTGPDNPDDYISLAERGSPDDAYVIYERTRNGNPLSMRMPEQPGSYELRYVMAQSDRVIARKPVTIVPLQALLRAPDSVEAGRGIEVEWTGPDGPDDFIAVAAPDTPADQYTSRALSRAGDPASVFAPSEPGTYELRYVWAEADSVLARRPLVVQ
jgi:Ca-activated chloride channel family protein